MLLLVDNFDSFTYNIVHAFEELGEQVRVVRNHLSVEECLALKPARLVLGPGPGTPEDAGVTKGLVARAAGSLPILGICLGHQAIGEVFGGKAVRGSKVQHGKIARIGHHGEGIFAGMAADFPATRYNSLLLDRSSFPEALEVTAWTAEGEIMALAHRTLPLWGLQFHPESVGTPSGKLLLANWLSMSRG